MKTTYEICGRRRKLSVHEKRRYVGRQNVEFLFPNPRFNWRECLCNRGVFEHTGELNTQVSSNLMLDDRQHVWALDSRE